jgi:hypothetical protein
MTGKGVGWRRAGHIRFKLSPRRIKFKLLFAPDFRVVRWRRLVQPDRDSAGPLECAAQLCVGPFQHMDYVAVRFHRQRRVGPRFPGWDAHVAQQV